MLSKVWPLAKVTKGVSRIALQARRPPCAFQPQDPPLPGCSLLGLIPVDLISVFLGFVPHAPAELCLAPWKSPWHGEGLNKYWLSK